MYYYKSSVPNKTQIESNFLPPKVVITGEPWTLKGEKFTCRCCGAYKKDTAFPRISEKELGFFDESGKHRAVYCYYCINEIFKRFQNIYHNDYRALLKICCLFGIYYDDQLAHKLAHEVFYWEDTKEPIDTSIKWIYYYIKAIMDDPEKVDKGFIANEELILGALQKNQNSYEGQADQLSEKDQKNRAKVIGIYHWDPFEAESVEDKPKLYEDLITMSTEGISEDLPKARAAIEIVRGYLRVDKITLALTQMQTSIESMITNEKSIKALTDQKKAELAAISTLAKENGFSEIANKMKSSGVGTLTGIIREMTEHGFDRGAVNKFDIDTTEAMKVIADISAESMFKQLSLTSADYADMVRTQSKMIREMQQTLAAQAEELRLLKEEHLREELIERYNQALIDKGIDHEQIKGLVEQELQYIPIIEYVNNNSQKEEKESEEE